MRSARLLDDLDAASMARASLRRACLLWTGIVVLTAIGLDRYQTQVGRVLRRETTLLGEPTFHERHGVSDEARAEIDFASVHQRLIPELVSAAARAESQHGRYEYATRRLLRALAPDRNLVDLWQELAVRLTADLGHEARRIDYLLWAHNHYLDVHGVPYRLEATLGFWDERTHLLTRSYRVLEEGGGRGQRVRLLDRIDGRPTGEPWLGHTDHEADGAFLVADRLLDFTVRNLWPALNPALDGRRPAHHRGSLETMRSEIARAMPGELHQLLVETAEDEQTLLEVAESIRSRRDCGSTFRVYNLPYRGLTPTSYLAIEQAVRRSEGHACPDLTLGEAAQLVGAAERLAETARLEDALEALTAIATRAVAIHELRHVADGPSRELECLDCPRSLGRLGRAELSAYLASFADTELGATSVLIACANPSRGRGIDGRAIDEALRASGIACEERLDPSFRARARAAEVRLFGERERAVALGGFPRAHRILARRTSLRPIDMSFFDELALGATAAAQASP